MAGKNDDVRDMTVTAAQLAELFDLSLQRIGQLAAGGVLERQEDRRFNLQRSIIAYERFLRSSPPTRLW